MRNSLEPPTRIGKYTILRPLGSGGMADVYVARHEITRKLVALKILKKAAASNPEIVARLHREAMMAERIHSRYVADVLDAGATAEGDPYLVLELLEGQTLSKRLEARGGRMSPGEAVAVLIELLAALEAAHVAGVIHRDVKPDNVFLARGQGGSVGLKLLDFGVARAEGDAVVETRVGTALGTVAYMPPEQMLGQRVGVEADIYAAGVVLYKLLTGAVPYAVGEDVVETFTRKHAGKAPRVDAVRPDVDPRLGAIVARAIEPDARRRHPTARAFREALAAWSEAPPRFAAAPRRWPNGVALVALLAALLGVLVTAACAAHVLVKRGVDGAGRAPATDVAPPAGAELARDVR